MKQGVMGRREFRQTLIDRVFEAKEKQGYKSINALVNDAIDCLEETPETIEAAKRGSLNMRISQENLEKIRRISEASKTKVGNRTLGGNETAVIALALETFIEKIEKGDG